MKPPNQYDTERLLSDALSHGDKAELAHLIGVSLSEISQQMNPEQPKLSEYYRFKRMLFWLSTEVNPEAARIIFADLQSSFESWLGRDAKVDNIAVLTAGVLKEAAELGAAGLENRPAHEIRKETLDVAAKADQLLKALDESRGGLRAAK